ncbi:MAG: ATP-binding protein [Pseudorhodobacter sp.]|nr:ATP-binding protein [Pseudorhodobacter sp.]
MLAEKGLEFSQSVDPPDTVCFLLPSDPASIRAGLMNLFSLDLLRPLTEDSLGAVQIVLAEALNNVVEHAYAGLPGMIEVWVTLRDGFMFVRILDDGLPMPGGAVPCGNLAHSDVLPEGGFGWHMIRTLSHDLTYQRDGLRNLLSFCIGVDYHS